MTAACEMWTHTRAYSLVRTSPVTVLWPTPAHHSPTGFLAIACHSIIEFEVMIILLIIIIDNNQN